MNGVFDRAKNNILKKLILTNVHLQKISKNALSGLKNLETLYLDQNQLENIASGVLNGLKNLQYLNISRNRLAGSLEKQNFTGVGIELKTLDLSFNRIEFIKIDCLEWFAELRVFNISHNRLTTLPSFTYNVNLNHVIISNNNIIEIGDNTFPRKDSMDSIDLSYNNISIISKTSGLHWYNMISSLKLDNNSLNDISTIVRNTKISQLSIKNNLIDNITCGSFCSELDVSHLNLTILTNISLCNTGTVFKASHNNLKQMPIWTGMEMVKIVELQYNKISKIPLGTFKNFKFLNYLRLDNNKIAFLDTGVFFGLGSLSSLNLSFNALSTIDHHVLFDLRLLTTLYLEGNMLTTLPIEDIFKVLPNLENLGLNKNHWHCATLMSILQFMMGHGIKHVHHESLIGHVPNLGGIRCWPENKTDMIFDNSTKISGTSGSTILTGITEFTTVPTTTRNVTIIPTVEDAVKSTTPNSLSTTTKLIKPTMLSQNTSSTHFITSTIFNKPTVTSTIFNKSTVTNFGASGDPSKQSEKLYQDRLPVMDESIKRVEAKVESGIYEIKNIFVILVILVACVLCIQIYKFYSTNIRKRSHLIAMNTNQQPLTAEIEIITEFTTVPTTTRNVTIIPTVEDAVKSTTPNSLSTTTKLIKPTMLSQNTSSTHFITSTIFNKPTVTSTIFNKSTVTNFGASGDPSKQSEKLYQDRSPVMDESIKRVEAKLESGIYEIKNIFYGNYIENLEFVESNLTEITNGVFDRTENYDLQILSLKDVHLKTISRNAFSGLKALETLNLEENQLESIVPGVLNGLDQLQYLTISNNLLAGSLEKQNFTGIGIHLKALDLRFNRIEFIEMNCLELFEQLRITGGLFCSDLYVSGLNLTLLTNISLCNTGKVFKASHNNLEQMPMWTGMEMVQIVELQYNKISKIPLGTFKDFKFLNSLRLDNNKIAFLDTGVFFGLGSLTSNMLTALPYDDLFKVLPNLTSLGLNKNHWHCSTLMSILQSMLSHKISHVHHEPLDGLVPNLDGIRCWPGNKTNVIFGASTQVMDNVVKTSETAILTTTKQFTSVPTTTRSVTIVPTAKETIISTTESNYFPTFASTTSKLIEPTIVSRSGPDNSPSTSSTRSLTTLGDFFQPTITIFEPAVERSKQFEKLYQERLIMDESSKKDDKKLSNIESVYNKHFRKRRQAVNMPISQQPLSDEIEI
ncbi:uncharacterized protein LOC113379492 [Ctenocephalides felis]|uniref:uncharacterized protein LOC113379492 n=1 Tax=Ctenocephalides felis TaxID=7515 RepID=UPI000E6E1FC4|nr:uncharacterized protein LOC113379492 [Ctenocephalides felis]